MNYRSSAKRFFASVAIVAAFGSVALDENVLPPSAVDNFNKTAVSIRIPSKEDSKASKTFFNGVVKIVTAADKEEKKQIAAAKIGSNERLIRAKSTEKPFITGIV